MAAKLSDAEVQTRLAKLDGWTQVTSESIIRTFKLKDFQAALMFVNAVGLLAEAAQHHPDIVIHYNNVSLGLTTHDVGSYLTDKDFDLATKINALPLLT